MSPPVRLYCGRLRVHLRLHDRRSESFRPTGDLLGRKDCTLPLRSEDRAGRITSDGAPGSDLVVIQHFCTCSLIREGA